MSFVRSAILFASILVSLNTYSAEIKLNITTFNLKWFGINGDPNVINSGRFVNGKPAEPRIPFMRDFINKHLAYTHVFVFQEVVDKPMLTQLLPAGWTCLSYDHAQQVHQYIVMCAHPDLTFAKVPYDNNFTIEEVAAGSERMRPALRAEVRVKKTNLPLLTLVGVHLKATPVETQRRINQVQAIAQDISKTAANMPAVIVGDFNTYTRNDTKLPMDDVEYFARTFKAKISDAVFVNHNPGVFTFRNYQFRNQFDQFYMKGPLKATSNPLAFAVCSATRDGKEYLNFEYYSKNISDHCPVSAQFILNVN